MYVRMSKERSLRKSQWFSFSTVGRLLAINRCWRLALTLSNTPQVLATLDDAAVWCLDIFGRTDDGEWDSLQ